ncbi:MAG: mitofilin family membrane protein [Pararhizobium sp.]
MAQGRPPRHSKSKRDPVTIDLEAEKTAEGGPAAAAPSDERPEEAHAGAPALIANTEDASATNPSDAPSPEPAPGDRAQRAPVESRPGAEAAVASDTTAEAAAAATADPSDARAPATPTDEPAAAETVGAPSASDHAEPTMAAAPAAAAAGRRRGGAGGGFVAGLLGGVIIAAGAFYLQDAGVLPVPGDNGNALSGMQSDVQSLRQEVDTLKKSVAAQANRPQAPAANDDLKAELAALSKKVDALQARPTAPKAPDLSGLKDQIAGAGNAAKQNGSDIAALSSRVDAIEKKLSQPSEAMKIARTVAAAGLNAAVDRGGPFAAELKAYEGIAPNDQTAKSLEGIAAAGVQSRQDLIDAYPAVADKIVAATAGPAADAGVFDRLVASARSIVTVRPTGTPEGDAPAALIARMGTDLKKGDLQGVVDEWSKLPETGKAASQAFIKDVKARLSAEGAVKTIMASATEPANGANNNGQTQ